MNPVLVAALVAGLVSLAGVLANLYVARQARRTTLLQTRLQLQASLAVRSSDQFNAFIAETERVRICCWSLLGHLGRLRQQQERSDIYDSLKIDREAFRQAIRIFAEDIRTFEVSWASVKPEIPLGIEHYIRSMRHTCLTLVANAQRTIQLTLTRLEQKDEEARRYDVILHSEKCLHQLLEALDQLISLLKTVNEVCTNERILSP